MGAKRAYKDIVEDQRLENEQVDVQRQAMRKEEELRHADQQELERQRGPPKRQRFDNDGTSTANVTIKSHA